MPVPPAALPATLRLLALLPGVKPRVAKDRLYSGLLNAVLAQRPSFKLWPSEGGVRTISCTAVEGSSCFHTRIGSELCGCTSSWASAWA